MRTLFYQPSCGISGDMHLAAMLELGVPLEHLHSELGRLTIKGEFELQVEPAAKMGINGTRVRVLTPESHHHRQHSDIADMIRASGYGSGIEERALRIFQHLAEAEAKIHNVPADKVHFHEVGAVDSIVDIVGAAIALDYLDVEQVFCNAVEVGAGYVNCAHGRFPVPAPATQELLTGVPCTYGGVQGESTTPTGAAILRASVNEFLPSSRFLPEQIGYGIGHKDFELPNVLRVVLGTVPETNTSTQTERHFKIEANIDDMAPEAFEPLLDALFAAGANDAWCTPIVMKKSRSATCLSVLATQDTLSKLTAVVLNNSTTIGLRVLPFEKHMLAREELNVPTRFGNVRVKRVTQPDGRVRWKSEHDDVLNYARATSSDYLTVKSAIDFEITQVLQAQSTADGDSPAGS